MFRGGGKDVSVEIHTDVETERGALDHGKNKEVKLSAEVPPIVKSLQKPFLKVASSFKKMSVKKKKKKKVEKKGKEKRRPMRWETTSNPSLVGRQGDLSDLRAFLLDDRSCVIRVHGMAGVGKTALMEAAASSVAPDFDVVIWARVGGIGAARRIQEDIGGQVGLSFPPGAPEAGRRRKLIETLAPKKFLLVLDDVVGHVDLGNVGIPHPSYKSSKVVLISRSLKHLRCRGVFIFHMIVFEVRFLEEEESWELFRRELGGDVAVDHPSIRPLVETVVARCGGLPLALITIAKAMTHARTPPEWEHAIKMLNEFPSRLPGMEDLLLTFRSSFDTLVDETTRQCLLCCSLFPEDHNIGEDQLRELWVANGLVDEQSPMSSRIIRRLTDEWLLFENGYGHVKMHSAVQMMVSWLTSDNGLCSRNTDLSQADVGRSLEHVTQIEAWRDAKRYLLMCEEMGDGGLPGDMPNQFPHLLTLLLTNCKCSHMFLRNLFVRAPVLKYLNLSDTSIVGELPEEIASLVGLRSLNLSGTAIGQLPAGISSLANLECLNLSRTGIKELPATLCKLAQLKHLHLRETRSLSWIPRGTIKCLTQLRTLDLYQSCFRSISWDSNSTGINLQDLIRCLPSLETLGLSLEDVDFLEALADSSKKLWPSLGGLVDSSEKPRVLSIRSLELISIPGTTTQCLYATLQKLEGLQELSIVGPCPESEELELESLFVSGGYRLIDSVLHLSGLQQRSIVKANLRGLRELHVDNCHRFQELTCVTRLRSLEYIRLTDCNGMEELIGSPVPYNPAFLGLKKISFCRLPRLRSISRRILFLYGLVELEVGECPNLTALPFDEHTANNIRKIKGEQEWWDKLEFSWESAFDGKLITSGDTTKVAFRRYFHPLALAGGKKGVEVLHKFGSSSFIEQGKGKLHEGIGSFKIEGGEKLEEIESYELCGEKSHEAVGSLRKKDKEKLKETESILPEEERELMIVKEFSSEEAGDEETDPIICTLLGDEFTSPLEKLQSIDGLVCGKEQQETLSTIQKYLQNDRVGVIGIQGIGGAGKTTLLKKLSDEVCSKQDSDFDEVIMVTASKYQHKKKIQKEIGEQLGLSLLACGPSFLEDTQAAILHQALSQEKKLLLILDGVREDWDNIGIPLLDKTHTLKILFATDVCEGMKNVEVVKMKPLNDSESWELFSRNVQNEGVFEDEETKQLIEQVVSKCDGLPLALIIVGRAMASKKTKKDWFDAIEKLDGLAKNLQGREQVVHYALKFGYDYLKENTLRSCLLYCSLFPENYNISIEELIQYWFGEGLLHDLDIDSAHNTGQAVIEQLKATSLLEDGCDKEKEVKMHDVVREFVLQLTSSSHEQSNVFLVHSGRGLTHAIDVKKWRHATRISLMHNEIETLPFKIPMCPNLSTLLINRNTSLNQIPKDFFKYMPALSVLDLSYTGIEELPKAIGLLSKLQFLNLSNTCIGLIPKEVGNLVQLRQLDLSNMSSLSNIPQKATFKLSKLQSLNLYNTGQWCIYELGHNKQRKAYVQDLKNLGQLKDLRLTIKSLISLQELQSYSSLLQILRSLSMDQIQCSTSNIISDILGKVEKLQVLQVSEVSQLEELRFPCDQLQSLEVISLEHLPRAIFFVLESSKHLPLRKLRRLHITGCHGFKDLNWVRQLPSLDYIELRVCYGIEEMTTGGVEEEVIKHCSFPRLKKMLLWDLPRLERISTSSLILPFLECLEVFHCPKLKKLPLTNQSGKKIKDICGHQEWWDSLEWDNQSVKANFLHCFKDPRNQKKTTSQLGLMGSNC